MWRNGGIWWNLFISFSWESYFFCWRRFLWSSIAFWSICAGHRIVRSFIPHIFRHCFLSSRFASSPSWWWHVHPNFCSSPWCFCCLASLGWLKAAIRASPGVGKIIAISSIFWFLKRSCCCCLSRCCSSLRSTLPMWLFKVQFVGFTIALTRRFQPHFNKRAAQKA